MFRYAALLGASFFNYVVSITGVVLLYVYYTHVRLLIIFIFILVQIHKSASRIYVHSYLFDLYLQESTCALNKFFISFNLILCVITSIVSVLPTVQEHQPRSGLLQSSVVTLYVVYLTWSGISNSPGRYKWFKVSQEHVIRILFLIIITLIYRSAVQSWFPWYICW